MRYDTHTAFCRYKNLEKAPCLITGDGKLNFEEYINLMEQQKTPDEREEDIIQAFRVFDSDNKGYIESADLRELLENMDWKVREEDLKDLITRANLDRDRRVSFEGRVKSGEWLLSLEKVIELITACTKFDILVVH